MFFAGLSGIAGAMPPTTDAPPPTKPPASKDEIIFADLDTNRDGRLSQAELDDSPKELQGVDFDMDGDGDVSRATTRRGVRQPKSQ